MHIWKFCLLPVALALRYAELDPADKSLVDSNRPVNVYGEVVPDAGHVYVVKPNATKFLVWEQIPCSQQDLVEALQLDATTVGDSAFQNEASHGHGPCCLNQHHYVCQLMIRDINQCSNMKNASSKFGSIEPVVSCPS